jgi:hypothetical protein
MRTELHSHRHALDAANEIRTKTLKWFPVHSTYSMCFGQRAENHLEFKAREVGAEAEVLADPNAR